MWVCLQLRLPKTITLSFNPIPQHYIVENRPQQFVYHETKTPWCFPFIRRLTHAGRGNKKWYVCLPRSVQANCANVAAARLMSKLLTMNAIYNGWYRAKLFAVYYARQAIPKRSHIYNTSKVQYMHDIKDKEWGG